MDTLVRISMLLGVLRWKVSHSTAINPQWDAQGLGLQNSGRIVAMPASLSEFVGQIERHRAAVTRYIRSLIRNDADAEDLAQETFLRAHTRLDTLRDQDALEGWLYQIATHVTIDRIRQRAHAAEKHGDSPLEELPLPDNRRPSALTVVQQDEMSACVQAHVARLSDGYKAVLLLHDVDGLTANEIATLLGLSAANVKMRLHRARRKLQATLQEACAFSQDERGVLVCDPKREPE